MPSSNNNPKYELKTWDIDYLKTRQPIRYRIFEAFPFLISSSLITFPFVFTFIAPKIVAFYVIFYLLYMICKSTYLSVVLLKAGANMRREIKTNWTAKLNELEKTTALKPSQITNAIFLATYNESSQIIDLTIKALTGGLYDYQKTILVYCYEERGGDQTRQTAESMKQKYNDNFGDFLLYEHPDGIEGEVKGKGANITYAGRQFESYIKDKNLDPKEIIITTIDADNRIHPKYLQALTYSFITTTNRHRKSFQPLAIFTNNIWDVPLLIRLAAFGNSFWPLVESMRPYHLRNFAAHSQSMQALIDCDFWSRYSVVEDGHHFWRCLIAFKGEHSMVPIAIPIFQDAPLASSYFRSYINQYLQLQRWAWGASDLAYLFTAFRHNKNIKWWDKLVYTWRLIEGYTTWAVAAILIFFAGHIPQLNTHLDSTSVLPHMLSWLTTRLISAGWLSLIVAIYTSLSILPPKPKNYSRLRYLLIIGQWALVPVQVLFFGSIVCLDSQIRLALGKQIGFRVTEKALKSNGQGVLSSHGDSIK